MATIQFCGGARHVTGANYLLTIGSKNILVDCGMFQGCHFCEGRNFGAFPYDPGIVDAVLITHAHIDHTGRLPLLAQRGFRGKIFSTAPTRESAELLLEDSLHVLGEEARERGRQALFDSSDIDGIMERWEDLSYGESFQLGSGIQITARNAGHILGSAMYEIRYREGTGAERKVVFTGDLGNRPSPFLHGPDSIDQTDFLVIESVYGDRLHAAQPERRVLLERAVEDIAKRGGTLMIPAFAMERTQELLFELNDLVENKRVPSLPIFVDSPLAIRITKVYERYRNFFSREAMELARSDDVFKFPGLKFTTSKEESLAINDVPPPKIVIAGSGMSNGGRILHHERRYLPDPNSILLVIGYQVAGSLGRRLLDGARKVRIFGEWLPAQAEVRSIGGYSAHADQRQLFEFIARIEKPIQRAFMVQGEENATLTLAQLARDHLGIDAKAPMWNDRYTL